MRGTSLEARCGWALVDSNVLLVAILGTAFVRLHFTTLTGWEVSAIVFALGAVVLHLVVGFTSGPYAPGHPRSSAGEVLDLTRTLVAVGLLGFAVEVLSPSLYVPRSVPVIAAGGALISMCAARFVFRALMSHGDDGTPPQDGCGEASEEIELDQHRR